jgi:hypothetical protein
VTQNPSLPQEEIDCALTQDPVRNRAEYLSEFRSDVEGFIPREIVEACVGDAYELPPQPGIAYRCFIDAASGVEEGDSYAIVIAHKAGDLIVIDVIREAQPPFSPAESSTRYSSRSVAPIPLPASAAIITRQVSRKI